MTRQADPSIRARGGRKPKPAPDVRDKFIGYRSTAAEHAEIRDRALAAGFASVSDFARSSLEGSGVRLRRGPSYPPEVVAQLRRLGNNVNQTLREARYKNFPPEVGEAAEEALHEVSVYLRSLLHGPEY
ncbi:plasmid mobilization protein [Methylobacterium tarhaniae]|uniref:plasmid mobilization protein n=1 Tax=Methylobacterium tarhaniae TaxID=1187852 RepID=UPI003CFDEB8E